MSDKDDVRVATPKVRLSWIFWILPIWEVYLQHSGQSDLFEFLPEVDKQRLRQELADEEREIYHAAVDGFIEEGKFSKFRLKYLRRKTVVLNGNIGVPETVRFDRFLYFSKRKAQEIATMVKLGMDFLAR